jgi:uncharacterized protein (DUF488 family)
MIFTVGHSTRAIEEFLDLLKEHGITQLVDVRTVPKSRYNPQFASDALSASLRKARISYTHMPELGGLRHPNRDSTNTGWRNASFRGYADYMQTQEFERGLEKLIDLSAGASVAIMCAESVQWRCHRSLIADALVARGVVVEEIIGKGRAQTHKLTPFAHVEGARVTYPGDYESALF